MSGTTGSQQDFTSRLTALLPAGWFPDVAPVLQGVLAGFGAMFAWLYSLIQYVDQQTRIATATDIWLDLIALDFLGSAGQRTQGQSDTNYRTQIQQAILAPKATRPAMAAMLKALTGNEPIIIEPAFPQDTLGLGYIGLGGGGCLGSTVLPYQCFITAYRPSGGGIANYPGLRYFGLGYSGLANESMVLGQVSDADIYAAIAANKPEGTIPWTRITNA